MNKKAQSKVIIIILLVVIAISLVFISYVLLNGEETSTTGKVIAEEKIRKIPFGFIVWDTLDIQEVRFNFESNQDYISVNDCTIFLRNNYEYPNFWAKKENKYQCVLWSVKNIVVDCSCEYIKKNLN